MSGHKAKVGPHHTKSKTDTDEVVQKRKTRSGYGAEAAPLHEDTSRPTAIFKPTQGRAHTVSIALPGSIIAKYAPLAFAGPRRSISLTRVV